MKLAVPVGICWAAMLLRAASEDAAMQVFVAKCGACHGAAAMGGLRLDSAEGGKSGRPAVRSGVMPSGGRLKPQEIEVLEKWVATGAG